MPTTTMPPARAALEDRPLRHAAPPADGRHQRSGPTTHDTLIRQYAVSAAAAAA